MKLRSITSLVIAGLLLTASPVFAQLNVEDEIELTRSYVEANRKTIIAVNMDLAEEESEIFWPVYKNYRANMKDAGDRLLTLIKKYAENYDDLSDEMATSLMIEYLDIEEDKLVLKRLYTDKLLDVLPPNKVVRFFQLENKMDAVVKVDLAVNIPLVKPKAEPEE